MWLTGVVFKVKVVFVMLCEWGSLTLNLYSSANIQTATCWLYSRIRRGITCTKNMLHKPSIHRFLMNYRYSFTIPYQPLSTLAFLFLWFPFFLIKLEMMVLQRWWWWFGDGYFNDVSGFTRSTSSHHYCVLATLL